MLRQSFRVVLFGVIELKWGVCIHVSGNIRSSGNILANHFSDIGTLYLLAVSSDRSSFLILANVGNFKFQT